MNPAATTTVKSSSGNPSVMGQIVTFTASATSNIAGTQAGTVSFYLDGATTLAGSAALSGGTAQFSTNSLSAGNQAVVATFISTNANFQSRSAIALTQAVTDFSISASPSSQTISRGKSGTYTLTLSPVKGFTGNVSLPCSGAPADVTCSVSPTQVTLNGTGTVQATVTIVTNHHANTGTSPLTFSAVSGTAAPSTGVALTIN